MSPIYFTADPVESLWVDVLIDGQPLLVSCIYRPKLQTSTEDNLKLIKVIEQACNTGISTFIFGDFNYTEIDWKTLTVNPTNSCSSDFITAYKRINAFQLVNFPTRIRRNEQSLLDLLLVSDKRLAFDVSQYPPIGLSDHVVITAKSQIQVTPKPTNKIYSRRFWSADYELINTHLQQEFSSVTANYERVMDILSSTISSFIPFRPKTVNPQKPWLTQEIFKHIEKKRKLWHKKLKSNSENDNLNYRNQNNFLKAKIKQSRRKYEQQLLASSDKHFYSYISRSLGSRLTHFSLRDESTNCTLRDEKEVANLFAKQFQSVFTREDLGHMPNLDPDSFCADSLEIVTFTPEKLETALKSLKPNSSPGEDEIPAIFLNKCAAVLSHPLSAMMNGLLRQGKLPREWKNAIVVPIYKKGNKHLPENYRPIILTSTLCKCMEKVLVSEMAGFLLRKGIIPPSQHGFLPGRSTLTNLLTKVHDWSKADDSGQSVDVFYLDFEKAFDKVPFRRLLHKLHHYGIRGLLLNLIQDFLQDRQFCVRIGSTKSNAREVFSGVPQGSVLGPLLFLVYISDLPNGLRSQMSSFADDTCCYSNPVTQNGSLQGDIDAIKQWTTTWQMPLNDSKCSILHLGKNNPRIQYFIGSAQVTCVAEQNDLGIVVTEDMKWENHINGIIKKANSIMYLISKAFKDPTPQMFVKLYKAYIRPRLEYAQSIWSPYYVRDIEALERVQRRATKIPPALRDLPYEQRLQRLNLPTLYERRTRGDLVETFKIISGHYKCQLNVFEFSDSRHLRGHNKKLCKERCARLLRRNFLSNRVVYNWNRLSWDTVNASSVNLFKNRLDSEMAEWTRSIVHYTN